MNPSVYLYKDTVKGFQLYFGECSIVEGLSLCDGDIGIEITCFGATLYRKYGYATEKELPSLNSVRSVVTFLQSEGDIGIIEFEADLSGLGSFSSHDDGECSFVLNSKQQCMKLLKAAVPPEFRDMLINNLLSNPGLYLTCSSTGDVTKYSSFDEYLVKNEGL